MAATTFTGQNIGARRMDRVKKGLFQGMVICSIYTIGVSVLLFFKAHSILEIFSSDPGVISYGLKTMIVMVPFYLLLSAHQILMGTMRGAGKSMQTMLISVGNMCVLRVIYINLFVPLFPSFDAVMWCYPITWATTVLMDLAYMKWGRWLGQAGDRKKKGH